MLAATELPDSAREVTRFLKAPGPRFCTYRYISRTQASFSFPLAWKIKIFKTKLLFCREEENYLDQINHFGLEHTMAKEAFL